MSEKSNMNFIVRQMQITDCEEVTKIWALVGFEETNLTNQIHILIDPEGLFVAQDPITGKLLGVCSGINLSPELAFIGQYAVVPEYQGLGIGSALWSAVMDHIGTDRNISLYAAKNMFPKYRDRSHFVAIPERLQNCFSGRAKCDELIQTIDGISVVPITDDNIEKVIQYDKEVCGGLDRTVLLREMSKINEYANAVAVNQTNDVLGYCIISVTNFNAGIVSPLYANDELIAELLIRRCCQSLAITQTNGLCFKCWNSDDKSIAIANKLGLELVKGELSPAPILFTKKVVDGNIDKIFCMSNGIFYPF